MKKKKTTKYSGDPRSLIYRMPSVRARRGVRCFIKLAISHSLNCAGSIWNDIFDDAGAKKIFIRGRRRRRRNALLIETNAFYRGCVLSPGAPPNEEVSRNNYAYDDKTSFRDARIARF